MYIMQLYTRKKSNKSSHFQSLPIILVLYYHHIFTTYPFGSQLNISYPYYKSVCTKSVFSASLYTNTILRFLKLQRILIVKHCAILIYFENHTQHFQQLSLVISICRIAILFGMIEQNYNITHVSRVVYTILVLYTVYEVF